MTPEERWDLRKRNIGRNVRGRRADWGKTQEALADKIGISSLTISRLENGAHGTSVETIAKIADAFGVPPHYMLLNIDRPDPAEDP